MAAEGVLHLERAGQTNREAPWGEGRRGTGAQKQATNPTLVQLTWQKSFFFCQSGGDPLQYAKRHSTVPAALQPDRLTTAMAAWQDAVAGGARR